MLMKSKFIMLFFAASLFTLGTSAQGRDIWRSQILREEVRFNVSLSSGTTIKNVIYKQHDVRNPGDDFYIFLMSQLGMEIRGRDHVCLESISHAEFLELLEIIIEKVKADHDGALSGLQLDFGFVEDFWVYLVEQMRAAPIPSATLADSKSRTFIKPFSDSIRDSTLVSDVCALASRIDRHCPKDNYYQGDGIHFSSDSFMVP